MIYVPIYFNNSTKYTYIYTVLYREYKIMKSINIHIVQYKIRILVFIINYTKFNVDYIPTIEYSYKYL